MPDIASGARDTLRGVLEPLSDRSLLQETPDQFMAKRGQAISSSKSVSRCSGA